MELEPPFVDHCLILPETELEHLHPASNPHPYGCTQYHLLVYPSLLIHLLPSIARAITVIRAVVPDILFPPKKGENLLKNPLKTNLSSLTPLLFPQDVMSKEIL